MIAFLRGTLKWVNEDEVVVETGGVGYRVYVPASARSKLGNAGDLVELYTFTQVRDDAIHVYGFITHEQCSLFRRLLGVSGVGPRVALGVISALAPDQFRRAVVFEDVDMLTGIGGVGKKTARRLILELKDAMGPAEGSLTAVETGSPGSNVGEALEALQALGYTQGEAAEVLEQVGRAAGPEATAAELVHKALRHLGSGAARSGR